MRRNTIHLTCSLINPRFQWYFHSHKKNIVADLGDQIASKNVCDLDDENIIQDCVYPIIHSRTVQSALALRNMFSTNGDQ